MVVVAVAVAAAAAAAAVVVVVIVVIKHNRTVQPRDQMSDAVVNPDISMISGAIQ